MNSFPYTRIAVIGTTGSGKSTLAESLSKKLAVPYIELDALYWEANWQEAEPFVFWERVESAIEGDAWVAVGNYRLVQHMIWDRAEAVIWLDYPLPILFWRLLTRTIRRAATQEELWNGNRESFGRFLKVWSRDSLIYWLFKTYWRRKREIPVLLSLPGYEHLKIFHFRHPRELEEWLERI
jgi:adenylate kinase family enzyme